MEILKLENKISGKKFTGQAWQQNVGDREGRVSELKDRSMEIFLI